MSILRAWKGSCRRIGYAATFGVLLLSASLICAARWSFFSPYYHLHSALVAAEEGHAADADAELETALRWAKVWRSEDKLLWLVGTYNAGAWKLDDARRLGYRNLLRAFEARAGG